jgi:hypothetical protein
LGFSGGSDVTEEEDNEKEAAPDGTSDPIGAYKGRSP